MPFRLVAIAGPLEGASFSFKSEAEAWIGRDPVNQICLSDPLASRKHCVVRRTGESFTVQDQDSSNGTHVNGTPVRKRELAHGDRVQVGESVFSFLLQETEALSPITHVPLDDGGVVTRSTVILEAREALYLQPDRLAREPLTERLARDLNTLLQISVALGKVRDLPELQRQLLELILGIIPAQFGVILLPRERFPASNQLVWLDRLQRPVCPPISRTIVNRILQEGVSILSNDVEASMPLSGVVSLVATEVQSLLAVPLTLYDQTLGVIYLDSVEAGSAFDEQHLQLLTGIAGLAAIALDNARQFVWLADEAERLRGELQASHEMIGESAPMQAVYRLMSKVAPAESSVLILGESGTGKELVAQAIHRASRRAQRPFVAINCAGLSDTLLESDLFGHEKGAFTGAVAQKKGKLEIAQGGTLFLDELGELPLPLQAKLLRVLQTREFERVGGTRTLKADIRILAATNRNLNEMIAAKTFRADLYFRLNVVALTLPPLRERRPDISLLAQYFVGKYARVCGRPVKGIEAAARELLVNYDWPGNVRELENTIERAIVLGSSPLLMPEDLPEAVTESASVAPSPYLSATKEAKKQLILQTLEKTNQNFTEAAKLLGIHPNNLHRLVRNLGLRAQLTK